MVVLTVTITTSNQPQAIWIPADGIISSNTRFQNMTVQYTGANTVYLGDASVSPTNGLVYTSGSSQPIQAFNGPDDLRDYYVYGTAGDRVVFMITR